MKLFRLTAYRLLPPMKVRLVVWRAKAIARALFGLRVIPANVSSCPPLGITDVMRLDEQSSIGLPLVTLFAPAILMSTATALLGAKVLPLIARPAQLNAAQSSLQLKGYRSDIPVLQPHVFVTAGILLSIPQLQPVKEPTLSGQAHGTPVEKPMLLVSRPVKVLLLQPSGRKTRTTVRVNGLTLVTSCG